VTPARQAWRAAKVAAIEYDRIAARTWRCCTMPTREALHLQSRGLEVAQRFPPERARTFSGMRCSSSTFSGTMVHNLELIRGAAGKWWVPRRSAQLLSKEGDLALVSCLPSKWQVFVECMATVARSHLDHENETYGKAGPRWHGKAHRSRRGHESRGFIRTVARRQGQGSIIRRPLGFPTLGKKTRNKSARQAHCRGAGSKCKRY